MTVSDRKQLQFNTYDEFFAFYLEQHRDRANRFLHGCGTILGLVVLVGAIAFGHPWWALTWPLIAYGFAWIGHFAIEGNRPASWDHPWWSFLSDFRMLWLMLTGRLNAFGKRADVPTSTPS